MSDNYTTTRAINNEEENTDNEAYSSTIVDTITILTDMTNTLILNTQMNTDTSERMTTQTMDINDTDAINENIDPTNNINLGEELNNNIDAFLPTLSFEDQDNIARILLNEIKGDTMDEKEKDTLRIMFQNINSLRPHSTDKWEATIRQMVEFQADIVGLCETSVNWKKAILKKLFQLKANRLLKNPVLTTTTTAINYDKNYLPGDCCQITANSWTTRCESKIYDDFGHGRWIGNTYEFHQQNDYM
jgi:hypothetical protein